MAMNGEERKRALGHGGAAEICRRTGRSATHVSYVLRGERRDRKVEVAVARKLGKPVDEVFPPLDAFVGAA